MNHNSLISSAFAAALALGLGSAAAAHEAGEAKGKEKCYGVAKPGQNDCANLAGTHDCSGQSTVDKDPGEWKYVPKGKCKVLKGMTEEEATAKVDKK